MSDIIGRERETEELTRIYHKRQAQLVALYGRRRVGKTYLVRELFKDRFAFYHTGVSPLELEEANLLEAQLANALCSYCGVMSHWNNYHTRVVMLTRRHDFTSQGMFNYEVTRFHD